MAGGGTGGGINGAELANRDKEDLGGSDGSSSGDFISGAGEPSGGTLGGTGGTTGGVPGDMLGGETPMGAGAGSLAGLNGGGIAAEAAPLGSADGSGTPGDKGDLGGGGGGTGPAGTASPGGQGRA